MSYVALRVVTGIHSISTLLMCLLMTIWPQNSARVYKSNYIEKNKGNGNDTNNADNTSDEQELLSQQNSVKPMDDPNILFCWRLLGINAIGRAFMGLMGFIWNDKRVMVAYLIFGGCLDAIDFVLYHKGRDILTDLQVTLHLVIIGCFTLMELIVGIYFAFN